MSRKASRRQIRAFDKYFFYTNSVQSAEHDAMLLWTILKKNWSSSTLHSPVLREDFCGTGGLCFEWVKLGKKHQAIGIDLDPTALEWGQEHHRPALRHDQSSRIKLIEGDVLKNHKVKPHMICALNFSYFFLKDRKALKSYFTSCKRSLVKGGMLALDVFGGPNYLMPHSDQRRNDEFGFDYWWEVESYDAITSQIKTAIHFQPDGQRRRNRVFRYDWRLWSPSELTDILREAGFEAVKFWAEGLDAKGFGDGKFRRIHFEKDCETWVCYIIAK
jgi:hypothetical protein